MARTGVAAAAALGMLTAAPAWAASCDSLASLTLPESAKVESATEVAAGTPFTPPGGKAEKLPAFCRVKAVATPTPTSKINFEVWLPAQGWNGKYFQVGNGGFAGAIIYTAMVDGLKRGYAVAGTDDGTAPPGDHSFLTDPARIEDWGSRAVHSTAVASKEVAAKLYGTAPKQAYFMGCSKGGHEAMMSAQKFPSDFTGIVGGNPAFDMTRLMAQMSWNAKHAAALSEAKMAVLHKGVLAACDRLDGAADGVLADPQACKFETKSLQCKSADAGDCLTAAEVAAADAIYQGPTNPRTGESIYPGMPKGSEGPATGKDFNSRYAYGWQAMHDSPMVLPQPFYAVGVKGDPKWDWKTLDYDRDVVAARDKLGRLVDATSSGMFRFKGTGAKLILYMGLADPLYSPGQLVNWYGRVVQTQAPTQDAGAKAMDDTRTFARLFLLPGFGHCAGGPGPNVIDPLSALEAWVEQGHAPDHLFATKYEGTALGGGGKVERTARVCAYPQMAKLRDKADPKKAESYSCVTPG
jgi:feruloyl esterase